MEIEPSYQETLDYLYSFVDYSLQKAFRYAPEKFDLGRMRRLMTELGNPEMTYPIIHVAGTKGKGSVSSFCASALQANGYRVGLYTSPHLTDYVERIQVNGEQISHADLTSLVNELKPVIESIPELTTFEITTAIAFEYFRSQHVEAAVIEVGLGGRLDATNVCIPKVTVITSISYDHTDLLGDTLTEIAGEKGGIIKPGIPVVLAPQKDEAKVVIEAIAKRLSCPLVEVDREYCFRPVSHSLDGQVFELWKSGEARLSKISAESNQQNQVGKIQLTIPLLGYHQIENATTAYAALQIAHQAGISISEAAIQQGLSRANWPGRFEILQKQPPIVVDSAHNKDSALKLRLTLDEYFPNLPAVLIFGASEDKDIAGMFAELLPRMSYLITTKSDHPRAADPDQLAELAQAYSTPIQAIAEIDQALIQAKRLARDESVILVTGSIFVIALARSILLPKRGE